MQVRTEDALDPGQRRVDDRAIQDAGKGAEDHRDQDPPLVRGIRSLVFMRARVAARRRLWGCTHPVGGSWIGLLGHLGFVHLLYTRLTLQQYLCLTPGHRATARPPRS